MTRPVACVIGDLSLVRALGRQGIPVAAVVSEADSVVPYSRYVREVVHAPSFVDHPREAVECLLRWGARQAAPPVLFYEGDDDLLALSRNRAALGQHYRLLLPRAELVEQLVDKVMFSTLAHELGLPVPTTRVLRHGTDLTESLRDWRSYPAVVKPAMRAHWFGSRLQTEIARGTQKALRVDTAEEMSRLLPLLVEHETDIILQAAVEGREENILSYHAYVRPDGELLAEFTGKKIRTNPRRYGLSTYLEVTDDAEVKAQGRAVLERLAFTGVLKMDFKRDERDRRLYLLEINPRFNLWHHPASVAGVCIPKLVYLDALQPGSAPSSLGARPGVRWMYAQADMRALREHQRADGLSIARWMREVITAEVREDQTLIDPLPGVMTILSIARRRASKAWARRKFRPSRQPAEALP